MMRHFSLRNLNRFLSVCVFLLFVFILVQLFGPINPSSIRYIKVATNQAIQPGSLMTYTSDSCRYVDANVQTTVIRSLVSVTSKTLQPFALTAETTANPPGCHVVQRQVLIPTGTPAGCYVLTIRAIYNVAPYRAPIARSATSNRFCVTVPTLVEQLSALQQQVTSLQDELNSLEGLGSTTAAPVGSTGVGQPAQGASNSSDGTTPIATPPSQPAGSTTPAPNNPPPTGLIQGAVNAVQTTTGGLLHFLGLH